MDNKDDSSFHNTNRKRPATFIPYIFQTNTFKPSLVSGLDPFLTHEAVQEYSGILSESDGTKHLPNYLRHFKTFADNVLDIPEKVFDDITKIHVGIEWKLREEEKEEEEKVAKQHAIELSSKNKLDKKVTAILKKHRHFVKRSCPVKIPFKSTLTHEEHEFYLRSFIKFSLQPPANSLDQKEYDQYMSMQNKVFNEQCCLMNFSFNVAQLSLKESNFVSCVMDQYIKDYVLHRCQRALSYPGYYRNVVEIPLKPQAVRGTPETFELTHIGHLLSLGTIPWAKLPNPHVETILPKDETVRQKKRPDCDEDYDRNTNLYKCPVSEDPNAEFLAKAHNASVVISSSAFKTIVDNLEEPFDNEWNIPIRIKTLKAKDEAGSKRDVRVIFIDKPLPRKTWTPLQKKFLFMKYSAKVKLSKYVPQCYFRMQPPLSERSVVQYDDFYNSTFDSSVELFGNDRSVVTPSPPLPPSPKPSSDFDPRDAVEHDLMLSDEDEDFVFGRNVQPDNSFQPPSSYLPTNRETSTSKSGEPSLKKDFYTNTNPQNNLNQESLSQPPAKKAKKGKGKMSTGGVLDDLLEKQKAFLKPKPSPSTSSERTTISANLSSYDVKPSKKSKNQLKPWSKSIDTDWDGYKIKECPSGSGTNVHYQLFSFENVEQQSPVKKDVEQHPIRIIVRHNIHGLSRFFRKPKESKTSSKAYLFFPKLENQVYFGCEVNSVSEITQQWASLVLRPNTTLLQVRVCAESASVVMTEEKQLGTILKEGKQKHLDFNPQSCFSVLNVLFNTLKKMSSGEYLLQHNPNTGAFMKLLGAVESSTGHQSHFDLHKFYSDGSVATRLYKTAPWLSIDTHVITPFHLFHKKIPGTFPMENKKPLSKDERKKRKNLASKKKSIKGYE